MNERNGGMPEDEPRKARHGGRTQEPDTGTGTGTGTGREDGRGETEEERADRRWQELLQEIRVAQTGVQILLGFLLTVVFTPLFHDLEQTDKTIYLVTVVLGSLATGALIGPVSFHRIVSGRRVKPHAVVWASRLTFTGILLLLATLTSALFLILRVATHDPYVPWLVSGVLAWYLICWFALPLWVRTHYADRS
ncbi:DUF6328 family protein [Streptomyces narbonensis]|uniref:DUF6328 family protein n=1 Tax=Streptomyces narbonensis TaxID=67333 RepID=UPI0019CEC86E|nr:DUF6328 family protein [Streptomyces narbonensis]GGW08787.1 hypothetical protein GCM10010230_56500 [Streptomyces narbonensis]